MGRRPIRYGPWQWSIRILIVLDSFLQKMTPADFWSAGVLSSKKEKPLRQERFLAYSDAIT